MLHKPIFLFFKLIASSLIILVFDLFFGGYNSTTQADSLCLNQKNAVTTLLFFFHPNICSFSLRLKNEGKPFRFFDRKKGMNEAFYFIACFYDMWKRGPYDHHQKKSEWFWLWREREKTFFTCIPFVISFSFIQEICILCWYIVFCLFNYLFKIFVFSFPLERSERVDGGG